MTTKKTTAIPQRADMEEKYIWNLGDLYDGDEAWEKDFAEAEKLIDEAARFAGTLASSPQTLFECLELRTRLSLKAANLYQYAKLNQDTDRRQSSFQALTDRAAVLSSRAAAAFSFVEPELLTIDEATLDDMNGQFPDPKVYDFYIREFNRARSHIRSGEVEELLAQSAVISRAPQSAFTMFDGADISYPEMEDEDGNTVKLTKQRYARFMESNDRRVRREANEKFYQPYQNTINTLGALLSASVTKDVFYARARKYESALAQALDSDNIPLSVYHGLIEATEGDLAPLHKFMDVRKKLLKLDDLYPYDAFCPLFPDQVADIPYEEAVVEVLAALEPLGETYCATLKQGFANRWVDVYETEGKAGGAYSWRNFSTHPFVLMNYNNTLDNMFTLAHEMGHAMHSHLSNKAQPFQKSQYSIFVAEVASTLNEGLLLQRLLGKATDVRQKAFLLNKHMDDTFRTFFHQVLYAHFELDVHEAIERGQALSPDYMNKLWEDLTRTYYGPAVTIDEYTKYKWSRIPHFYVTYYVYQYATSYAASQAILDKFLAGEKGIIDKYLNLLSLGGSDHPINQLMTCGVDMTTAEPVKATLRLFADQVDRLDKLADEL